MARIPLLLHSIEQTFNKRFRNILTWALKPIVTSLAQERKYATWRIVLLWLLSGLGGNFFSALFEDKCTLVVGASGAVFGMVGLFVGDFMLNFETIKRCVVLAGSCLPFQAWTKLFWSLDVSSCFS